jgi:hypothetical protein
VISDEQAEAAKDELGRAIQAYQDAVQSGEYVSGWVLVTHRQSIDLERDHKTVVGCLVPTHQSFVETRGLLSAASDSVQFGNGS